MPLKYGVRKESRGGGDVAEEGGYTIEFPELKGENTVYTNVRPEVEIPILFRQWRKEQGLSQEDIAEKIKAPYQTIQKLEKTGCNPTLKTLRKAAKALGKNLLIDVA